MSELGVNVATLRSNVFMLQGKQTSPFDLTI